MAITTTTTSPSPLSLTTTEKTTYSELLDKLDFYNKLASGMRDVYENRLTPADQVFSRIRNAIAR